MRTYMPAILMLTVFVAFTATVSTADLTDGLVAYWPLEECIDGMTPDASGNGHDGTLLGEPSTCGEFDGEDDLVEIEPFDVVGGGITIAAWIKPDDFDIDDGRIISKANEWGGNDHWWMLSTIEANHVLRFRLKTNDGLDTTTLIASSGELMADEWAHVAATWDGSDMKLYKDGVEVGSVAKGGTEAATDDTVKVAIGSQPSDAFASDLSHVVKFFDGMIEDVVVYSRALSQDEIQELAEGSVPAAVSAVGKLTTTWAQVKQ